MNTSCRICGEENSPEAQYCSNCRSRLSMDEVATGETAAARRIGFLAGARRRRVILWAVAVAIVIVTGGWIGYANLVSARSLPPPSSDISSAPVAGDWPMVQREPAHSAFAAGGAAELAGNVKWRFEIDTPIFSSPAAVGDRLYVSTGDKRILALDAVSGDLLWEHTVLGPVNSSPAVAGDLVYVGLRDGRVLALNRETGEKRWDFQTADLVYSSPAVYQGVVYIGSWDSRLYALDAITGEERWNYLTGGHITSDPAVNQEVTAVISQDWYLNLIDLATGKHRLDFKLASASGSPTIHGRLVFVADERGVVRAIDWQEREARFEKASRRLKTQLFAFGLTDSLPSSKGFVWGFRRPGERFVGTPAVANETVYAGSASGNLYALEEFTGELVWSFAGESRITTSPSVLGQTVFVGDESGRLYSIDAITGELRWEFVADDSISSTPVVANNTLYVASQGGTLYAIE